MRHIQYCDRAVLHLKNSRYVGKSRTIFDHSTSNTNAEHGIAVSAGETRGTYTIIGHICSLFSFFNLHNLVYQNFYTEKPCYMFIPSFSCNVTFFFLAAIIL